MSRFAEVGNRYGVGPLENGPGALRIDPHEKPITTRGLFPVLSACADEGYSQMFNPESFVEALDGIITGNQELMIELQILGRAIELPGAYNSFMKGGIGMFWTLDSMSCERGIMLPEFRPEYVGLNMDRFATEARDESGFKKEEPDLDKVMKKHLAQLPYPDFAHASGRMVYRMYKDWMPDSIPLPQALNSQIH